MKKTIYILLAIVVLIIIAVVIISNYTKQLPNEIKDTGCISDDDCVIVGKLDPQNPCCNLLCEVEIISKQAEVKRENWRLENCEGSYIFGCPIDKCAVTEKLPKSRCLNNQCKIEWVERP